MKDLTRYLQFIYFLLLEFSLMGFATAQSNNSQVPVRIGIAGLSHDHVHGLLRQMDQSTAFQIVGIAESNTALVARHQEKYKLSPEIVYGSLGEMLAKVEPQAVLGFGSTYAHLDIVEQCAPVGIHVMVEKPLAVNMMHAEKMKKLVDDHNIHLLVNYETTWYPSNHRSKELVDAKAIGELRKIVVHDGHRGPREIGCSEEFLSWLTDPILNGGGALTDFGCYGANLITWLMQGAEPLSVSATIQQIKPDLYPLVDDEATILLTYPETQGIIQASWNWPFSRKDMEIYGRTGTIMSVNSNKIRVRLAGESNANEDKIESRAEPYNDPFLYFTKVILGEIKMPPFALSSLENNMIVTKILDAAKESSKNGSVIKL